MPLAGKLLAALAEGLKPWFAGLELGIDLDAVTALSEDRERLWAQVNAVDFLTLNEKRGKQIKQIKRINLQFITTLLFHRCG